MLVQASRRLLATAGLSCTEYRQGALFILQILILMLIF